MKHVILPAAACCLILPALTFAEDHRQLGAHEHGHGTLSLAIDGKRVSLELEAPGDDIIGFEHDPSSPAETQQVDAAKATLSKPLVLLGVPRAAKCMVTDAKVAIQEEEHEGGAERKDEKAAAAHHNAFHAEYTLECDEIAAFTGLDLSYFDAFKKAQSLTVTVIAPKGQSKYEATRDTRAVSLSDVM